MVVKEWCFQISISFQWLKLNISHKNEKNKLTKANLLPHFSDADSVSGSSGCSGVGRPAEVGYSALADSAHSAVPPPAARHLPLPGNDSSALADSAHSAIPPPAARHHPLPGNDSSAPADSSPSAVPPPAARHHPLPGNDSSAPADSSPSAVPPPAARHHPPPGNDSSAPADSAHSAVISILILVSKYQYPNISFWMWICFLNRWTFRAKEVANQSLHKNFEQLFPISISDLR